MFYTGKSTACHTCRQRRLRCDEVRPHCLKCRRAGRECKGYRDDSAYIIRDMTSATIQKFGRAKRLSTSSTSSSGSSGESAVDRAARPSSVMLASGSVACRSLSGHGAHRSSLPGTFPPSLHDGTLSLPVEDQAFCYFATRYSLAPTQFLDPGYLPVLRLISGRKYMGQCLSCALSAVSLAAFSTRPNSRRTRFRALKVYSTALRLINEEVQRPGSCEDDELVAAVLLLALFEIFTSESVLGWVSHVYGAAAMIGARSTVSSRNKFRKVLLRVIGNETVKLTMMGFSSPHTGTDSWLNWLSDPTYTTYVTPNADEDEWVKEEEDDDELVTELLPSAEDGVSGEITPLRGADAIEKARSGRDGTLTVPNLPNFPVGHSRPKTEGEEAGITRTLDDTKKFAEAYSKYKLPDSGLTTRGDVGSYCDEASSRGLDSRAEAERQKKLLGDISLYVSACTARVVTYNIMARCAAALPGGQATEDYATAVTMGRKMINEVIGFAPYFHDLMEGGSRKTSSRFGSPQSIEDSDASDSSSSSAERGSVWSRSQQSQRSQYMPNLAKSYIGYMFLWPLTAATTTELIEADQLEYITRIQNYIAEDCGIRMAKGVQQFCDEKRQLSGFPRPV